MGDEIPVESLMDVDPTGSKADEVGRDPDLDDERGFDHGEFAVVGVCERCETEIHEGVVGHYCDGAYRQHRDGEGILEVAA